MANNWPSATVSELQDRGSLLVEDGNHGENRPRPAEFVSEGLAFVRAADIKGDRVAFESVARINRVARDRVRKGIGQDGDVILSHKGTVGKVAFIEDGSDAFVCSPQTTFWRVIDHEVLDRKYLLAVLKSQPFKNQLMAFAGETDMAPYVSLTNQRRLKITLPPIHDQRAIAHILGTLDDKIELNRQMNQTLDEIARTLFKSWFVDFDPVRAKAEGRQPEGMDPETAALFPNRLVDSELGLIPEGWSSVAMGDMASLMIGGDWGQDEAFEGGIEVISLRGVDLERLRGTGYSDAPKRWIKPSSLERRKADSRDVLVAASGAGPTGRPLWFAPELEAVFDLPVTYSNFCKRLRCHSKSEAMYLDFYLREMRLSGEIWEYANGTSIPNLNANGLLESKRLVLPSVAILERFAEIAIPFWKLLYSGESRTLAELRDALLPELLSGRLRPKVAESLVGEAL